MRNWVMIMIIQVKRDSNNDNDVNILGLACRRESSDD
jgi:hypothetical protein